MFPLKQEVLHDVALHHHLEGLAGAPDTLQAVGMNTLLLVENQPRFDPFRRRNHVSPAPAHGLQFLENPESLERKVNVGSSLRLPPE